jgi:hypothetical protein
MPSAPRLYPPRRRRKRPREHDPRRPVSVRSLSNGASRSPSGPQRLVFGVLGALAWAGLALLGLAVKVALLPRRRSAGASALIWGILFAAYLWWGSHQVGLREWKAELLGVLGGLAAALFVYLRGASLERPTADRPGVFLGRLAAKRRKRTTHT